MNTRFLNGPYLNIPYVASLDTITTHPLAQRVQVARLLLVLRKLQRSGCSDFYARTDTDGVNRSPERGRGTNDRAG